MLMPHAQSVPPPTLIAVHAPAAFAPLLTREGTRDEVVVPFPSWPFVLAPQQ